MLTFIFLILATRWEPPLIKNFIQWVQKNLEVPHRIPVGGKKSRPNLIGKPSFIVSKSSPFFPFDFQNYLEPICWLLFAIQSPGSSICPDVGVSHDPAMVVSKFKKSFTGRGLVKPLLHPVKFILFWVPSLRIKTKKEAYLYDWDSGDAYNKKSSNWTYHNVLDKKKLMDDEMVSLQIRKDLFQLDWILNWKKFERSS